jgi:hypothetical protein
VDPRAQVRVDAVPRLALGVHRHPIIDRVQLFHEPLIDVQKDIVQTIRRYRIIVLLQNLFDHVQTVMRVHQPGRT